MTKPNGNRLASRIVDETIVEMPADRVRAAALTVVEMIGMDSADAAEIRETLDMLGISDAVRAESGCTFHATGIGSPGKNKGSAA